MLEKRFRTLGTLGFLKVDPSSARQRCVSRCEVRSCETIPDEKRADFSDTDGVVNKMLQKPQPGGGITNWILHVELNTDHYFFFSVIAIPPRTTVSRLGSVVMASMYFGSAMRGLMLWARISPPGRSSGNSLFR